MKYFIAFFAAMLLNLTITAQVGDLPNDPTPIHGDSTSTTDHNCRKCDYTVQIDLSTGISGHDITVNVTDYFGDRYDKKISDTTLDLNNGRAERDAIEAALDSLFLTSGTSVSSDSGTHHIVNVTIPNIPTCCADLNYIHTNSEALEPLSFFTTEDDCPRRRPRSWDLGIRR